MCSLAHGALPEALAEVTSQASSFVEEASFHLISSHFFTLRLRDLPGALTLASDSRYRPPMPGKLCEYHASFRYLLSPPRYVY